MSNYQLWCKRVTGDTWFPMSYPPRSYEYCESIQEHYEGEWGNLYTYDIRPSETSD